MPTTNEIFDCMHGQKYFSTLDFYSGFHQTALSEDSYEKTAFSAAGKHWEFKVTPFGVKNGVAAFNRVLTHVLQDKLWRSCMAYVDDVIVMSRTAQEHIEKLDEIFNCLEKANFKLNVEMPIFQRKT